jgi:hypothetical protein
VSAIVELSYPFGGHWRVRNSPADRVPSHGTRLYASAYAIDFVPVDERGISARMGFQAFMRPEAPDRFAGFGRPILSPVAGTVVSAHDGEEDHSAYRGIPSVGYALTQYRRAASGWRALAGNHVLVENNGVVVALCHLRQGSVAVRPGMRIRRGEVLGLCGNSGNSTEPHVHVQAMDGPDIASAAPVQIVFSGRVPKSGEIVRAGRALA